MIAILLFRFLHIQMGMRQFAGNSLEIYLSEKTVQET